MSFSLRQNQAVVVSTAIPMKVSDDQTQISAEIIEEGLLRTVVDRSDLKEFPWQTTAYFHVREPGEEWKAGGIVFYLSDKPVSTIDFSSDLITAENETKVTVRNSFSCAKYSQKEIIVQQ
ncbi:MAG: hypothetical protein F6J98_05520 [Moorea sp. SIO4G2]|nr:hypothetical protein [Moorena sp. SIO4G2]